MMEFAFSITLIKGLLHLPLSLSQTLTFASASSSQTYIVPGTYEEGGRREGRDGGRKKGTREQVISRKGSIINAVSKGAKC